MAINYLAVLVATVVNFVLGGLWYSPLLFGKKWMALMNVTEEEIKKKGGGIKISSTRIATKQWLSMLLL